MSQVIDRAPKYAVSKLDPAEVLNEYLHGRSTKEIAAANGISRQALNDWLLRKDEEGWKRAQSIVAEEDAERAREVRQSIQDKLGTANKEERDRLNIALACARDDERGAMWRLERVNRRIYGQDQPPNGAAQVAIQINLRRSEKPLESVGAVVLAAK